MSVVTIMIVTDSGKAYCMSRSVPDAVACIESLRRNQGKINVSYIKDSERRLRYLSRAFDAIEETDE